MSALSLLSAAVRLRSLRTLLALIPALLLCTSPAQAAGPTGLLNDTGQTQCDNGSNVMGACDATSTGDAPSVTMPRQDGRFGRDAASPSKIGGGAAGFDFSRVCFNGDVQGSGTCTGTLVANTAGSATASPGTDWACSRDNVTNLIWSLESGLGDWTTYAQVTLPTATNGASRCGFATGWRLPTVHELLGIVLNGLSTAPTIDVNYFPGTVTVYWTSETFAPNPSYAWIVDFYGGDTLAGYKTSSYYVRLVRSGQ
jgi:hypothetical protein